MKGIITYSLCGRTHTEQSELTLGGDGRWHPEHLPQGAELKGVTLILASMTNDLAGQTEPWQTWLNQCVDGLDGPEPLLMGDA